MKCEDRFLQEGKESPGASKCFLCQARSEDSCLLVARDLRTGPSREAAVCPGAGLFASLSLSFLIWKMGIMTILIFAGWLRGTWEEGRAREFGFKI